MTIARQNDKTSPAFELKGSALTLMVLHLFTADRERLNAQLQTKFATAAAGFFRNAPLLIDGCTLPDDSADMELLPLIEKLRTLGLVPVALRGGSPMLQEQGLAASLGLLPALRGEAALREMLEPIATSDDPPPAAAEEDVPLATVEPSPLPAVATGTRVVTRTVRSGQRIVAASGDLLVLGAVNAGAEILAAGNIHVYGPLRGRALAGIHGDSTARICALQFFPELVAVAGDYLLHDELDPAQLGGAVVVTIADEKLKIETIGAFAPSHV